MLLRPGCAATAHAAGGALLDRRASGVQSRTVPRPTFERLHRLGLVEYDKDDPNGGKRYKLTPLGSAALLIYDLQNRSGEQQNDQKT